MKYECLFRPYSHEASINKGMDCSIPDPSRTVSSSRVIAILQGAQQLWCSVHRSCGQCPCHPLFDLRGCDVIPSFQAPWHGSASRRWKCLSRSSYRISSTSSGVQVLLIICLSRAQAQGLGKTPSKAPRLLRAFHGSSVFALSLPSRRLSLPRAHTGGSSEAALYLCDT